MQRTNERMLYFAYGSNLNQPQMDYRCPAARPLAAAKLHDYTLRFRSNGRGRGVANIEESPGSFVPGVVWEITEECLVSLDRYEGYPWLYSRKEFELELEDGGKVEAIGYYMVCDPLVESSPSKGYLGSILEGYESFNLNIRKLLSFLPA